MHSKIVPLKTFRVLHGNYQFNCEATDYNCSVWVPFGSLVYFSHTHTKDNKDMVKNVPAELVITQTSSSASATFLGRLQEMVVFQIYFPKNLKDILKYMPKY